MRRLTATTSSPIVYSLCKLVRPTTYYVRSTGNDSNEGFSEDGALATIQEALDRLPSVILSDVLIDVGVGSFNGFHVAGLLVASSGTLTIRGTLGGFTPTTGTAIGTATSGTITSLTDTEQTWTANNLRGKLLCVDSEYRLITDNTNTVINVLGEFLESCDDKTYSIVEQKTIINTTSYTDTYGSTRVFLEGLTGGPNNIVIQDLNVDGAVSAMRVYGCIGVLLSRLYLSGWTYDGVLAQGNPSLVYEDLFASSTVADTYGYCLNMIRGVGSIRRCLVGHCPAQVGYNLYAATLFDSNYWHVESLTRNGANAIQMQGANVVCDIDCTIANLTGASGIICGINAYNSTVSFNGNTSISGIANGTGAAVVVTGPASGFFESLSIESVTEGLVVTRRAHATVQDLALDTASTYGMRCVYKSNLLLTGTISLANCTLDALRASNNSVISCKTVTGSGNDAYGICAELCSRVFTATGVTVSGASGDLLIDDVAKTYTSDFNDDKDVVLGAAGSIVQRYDSLV